MKPMLAVFVMLAVPAAAQENRPHGSTGGAQGGGGATHSAPSPSGSGSGGAVSSGGSSGSSGGSVSSGGSTSAGSAGRADGGARHAASGGSGTAVTRGGERGTYTAGGRHGDGGSISTGAATPASAPGTGAGAVGDARAAAKSEGSPRNVRSGDGTSPGGPAYARPRSNEPVVGTAVPRGSVPPASRPGVGIVTTGAVGYYPWWWFGGAGLYGGYWGYNNYYGYNNYTGYGSYYGYSDPWFGGYPDEQDTFAGSGSGSSGTGGFIDEGALRLKIKPKDAEVYVDGFYVGVVDDFDGMFQKLHIETGPHRIEVRAPGYEPLIIEVRITADHATTYQGELKRIK